MSDKKNLPNFCPKLNRRNFLKGAGALAAGLAVPLTFSCDMGVGPGTSATALNMPPSPDGKAAVGIVRDRNVAEMVRAAVDLAGGLDEIREGDSVVIKPNITSISGGNVPFATTNDVMRAVIRLVKERTGAGYITVAESSAFGVNTQSNAQINGLLNIVQIEGVKFVRWEAGEYVTVRSDLFQFLDFDFRIPKPIADGSFDHYINVPILKNHEMIANANADYTCCIKNHVGVMHWQDRLGGGGSGIHTKNLGEVCAELSMAVPVHTMNIVDALTITLTDGPVSMNSASAHAGLILASKDRVACDSLAVAVLKHYAKQQGIRKPYVEKSVWDQAQIRRAQELNLGRSKEKIVILDDGVDNINAILKEWA